MRTTYSPVNQSFSTEVSIDIHSEKGLIQHPWLSSSGHADWTITPISGPVFKTDVLPNTQSSPTCLPNTRFGNYLLPPIQASLPNHVMDWKCNGTTPITVLAAILTPEYIAGGTELEGGLVKDVVAFLTQHFAVLNHAGAKIGPHLLAEWEALQPVITKWLDALSGYVAIETTHQAIAKELEGIPTNTFYDAISVGLEQASNETLLVPEKYNHATQKFVTHIHELLAELLDLKIGGYKLIPGGYTMNTEAGHSSALKITRISVESVDIQKIDLGAGIAVESVNATRQGPIYTPVTIITLPTHSLFRFLKNSQMFTSIAADVSWWQTNWLHWYSNFSPDTKANLPQRAPQLSGTCFNEWPLIALELVAKKTMRPAILGWIKATIRDHAVAEFKKRNTHEFKTASDRFLAPLIYRNHLRKSTEDLKNGLLSDQRYRMTLNAMHPIPPQSLIETEITPTAFSVKSGLTDDLIRQLSAFTEIANPTPKAIRPTIPSNWLIRTSIQDTLDQQHEAIKNRNYGVAVYSLIKVVTTDDDTAITPTQWATLSTQLMVCTMGLMSETTTQSMLTRQFRGDLLKTMAIILENAIHYAQKDPQIGQYFHADPQLNHRMRPDFPLSRSFLPNLDARYVASPAQKNSSSSDKKLYKWLTPNPADQYFESLGHIVLRYQDTPEYMLLSKYKLLQNGKAPETYTAIASILANLIMVEHALPTPSGLDPHLALDSKLTFEAFPNTNLDKCWVTFKYPTFPGITPLLPNQLPLASTQLISPLHRFWKHPSDVEQTHSTYHNKTQEKTIVTDKETQIARTTGIYGAATNEGAIPNMSPQNMQLLLSLLNSNSPIATALVVMDEFPQWHATRESRQIVLEQLNQPLNTIKFEDWATLSVVNPTLIPLVMTHLKTAAMRINQVGNAPEILEFNGAVFNSIHTITTAFTDKNLKLAPLQAQTIQDLLDDIYSSTTKWESVSVNNQEKATFAVQKMISRGLVPNDTFDPMAWAIGVISIRTRFRDPYPIELLRLRTMFDHHINVTELTQKDIGRQFLIDCVTHLWTRVSHMFPQTTHASDWASQVDAFEINSDGLLGHSSSENHVRIGLMDPKLELFSGGRWIVPHETPYHLPLVMPEFGVTVPPQFTTTQTTTGMAYHAKHLTLLETFDKIPSALFVEPTPVFESGIIMTVGRLFSPAIAAMPEWEDYDFLIPTNTTKFAAIGRPKVALFPWLLFEKGNPVPSVADKDGNPKGRVKAMTAKSIEHVSGEAKYVYQGDDYLYLFKYGCRFHILEGYHYEPDPDYTLASHHHILKSTHVPFFSGFNQYLVFNKQNDVKKLLLVPGQPFSDHNCKLGKPVTLSDARHMTLIPFQVDTDMIHPLRQGADGVQDRLFLAAIFYRDYQFDMAHAVLLPFLNTYTEEDHSDLLTQYFPVIDHPDAVALRSTLFATAHQHTDLIRYAQFESAMPPLLATPPAQLRVATGDLAPTLKTSKRDILDLRMAAFPNRLKADITWTNADLTENQRMDFTSPLGRVSEWVKVTHVAVTRSRKFPLAQVPLMAEAQASFNQFIQSQTSIQMTNPNAILTHAMGLEITTKTDISRHRSRIEAQLNQIHPGPKSDLYAKEIAFTTRPRLTIQDALKLAGQRQHSEFRRMNPTLNDSDIEKLISEIALYCIYHTQYTLIQSVIQLIHSKNNHEAATLIAQNRAYDLNHRYALDCLIFETQNKILLRPAQIELIDQIGPGTQNHIIQHFTGIGKSTVMPLLTHLFDMENQPVVVVATTELIHSMSRLLSKGLAPYGKDPILLNLNPNDDIEPILAKVSTSIATGFPLVMTPDTLHLINTLLPYYVSIGHHHKAHLVSKLIHLLDSAHFLLDECDKSLSADSRFKLASPHQDSNSLNSMWQSVSDLMRAKTTKNKQHDTPEPPKHLIKKLAEAELIPLGKSHRRFYDRDEKGKTHFYITHVVSTPRRDTRPIGNSTFFDDPELTAILTYIDHLKNGLGVDEMAHLFSELSGDAEKEAIAYGIPHAQTSAMTRVRDWTKQVAWPSEWNDLQKINIYDSSTIAKLTTVLGKLFDVIDYFIQNHNGYKDISSQFHSTVQNLPQRMTGTSATLTQFPARFQVTHDHKALGEFIAGVTQPIHGYRSGYPAKIFSTSQWKNNIREWLAISGQFPRVLIDAGAYFQVSEAELIPYLLSVIPSTITRIITVDEVKGIPVAYSTSGKKTVFEGITGAQDLVIYPTAYCVGMDIQHEPGTIALVTLSGEGITDLIQPIGRMRHYNRPLVFKDAKLVSGHAIRFAMTPKVANRIRADRNMQTTSPLRPASVLEHGLSLEYKRQDHLALLELEQATQHEIEKEDIQRLRTETLNPVAPLNKNTPLPKRNEKTGKDTDILMTPLDAVKQWIHAAQPDWPSGKVTQIANTLIDDRKDRLAAIKKITVPISPGRGATVRLTSLAVETDAEQSRSSALSLALPTDNKLSITCRDIATWQTTLSRTTTSGFKQIQQPRPTTDAFKLIQHPTFEWMSGHEAIRRLACVGINDSPRQLFIFPEIMCGPLARCVQNGDLSLAISHIGVRGIGAYLSAHANGSTSDWILDPRVTLTAKLALGIAELSLPEVEQLSELAKKNASTIERRQSQIRRRTPLTT